MNSKKRDPKTICISCNKCFSVEGIHLYIEKEGFFNVLKEKKIPEKYDMALLTSKGYASRAVKDLLDAIGENSREEITFFCIYDADAYGTTIYDTLQN